MLHTIRTIAQAQLRVVRNSLWRGSIGRKVRSFALVMLVATGSWGLFLLMRGAARLLSSERFAALLRNAAARNPALPVEIAPFIQALPSAVLFFVLALLLLTGFSTVLSSLYLSGDMDFLLAAPVPMRAVFLAKLFGGLSVPYVLLFLLVGPGLVGFGQGLGYGAAYFVTLPIVLLLFPLLPVGAGTLLVMLVVRIIPARRAREIVGVIGALIGAGWYLASQVGARSGVVETVDWLRQLDQPLLPSYWAGRALTAAGQADWVALASYGSLFAGLSLAVFGLSLLLAEHLYYSGWANMAAAGGTIRQRGTRRWQPTAAVPRRLVSIVLPPETWAILRKDLRLFPRDLRNLQQLIFPLAMAGIWTFQLARGGPASADNSAVAQLANTAGTLGVSFFIALIFSSALGGPGISREGASFWLLKAAPVSAWRLLLAKFILAYLPFPLVGTLFIALLAGLRGGTPGQALSALALVWLLGLGATAITTGIGAAYPRLDWTNPARQTTWQAGCLAPIAYLFYLALAGGAVLGLPALAAFAPHIATLLTATGWVLAVVLTAGAAWGALAFGSARLEKMEVS